MHDVDDDRTTALVMPDLWPDSHWLPNTDSASIATHMAPIGPIGPTGAAGAGGAVGPTGAAPEQTPAGQAHLGVSWPACGALVALGPTGDAQGDARDDAHASGTPVSHQEAPRGAIGIQVEVTPVDTCRRPLKAAYEAHTEECREAHLEVHSGAASAGACEGHWNLVSESAGEVGKSSEECAECDTDTGTGTGQCGTRNDALHVLAGLEASGFHHMAQRYRQCRAREMTCNDVRFCPRCASRHQRRLAQDWLRVLDGQGHDDDGQGQGHGHDRKLPRGPQLGLALVLSDKPVEPTGDAVGQALDALGDRWRRLRRRRLLRGAAGGVMTTECASTAQGLMRPHAHVVVWGCSWIARERLAEAWADLGGPGEGAVWVRGVQPAAGGLRGALEYAVKPVLHSVDLQRPQHVRMAVAAYRGRRRINPWGVLYVNRKRLEDRGQGHDHGPGPGPGPGAESRIVNTRVSTSVKPAA